MRDHTGAQQAGDFSGINAIVFDLGAVDGLHVEGVSELEKATLGTACLNLSNVDIDTLAIVDYRALINHAESHWYTFLVIHDGRPIGEINVREYPVKSGNYETFERSSSGSARLDRLMELQNAYPSGKGFTITHVRIKELGRVYVVFKDAKAFLMTAVGKRPWYLIMERREDERYPLVPAKEGIRQIKENYDNRYIMPLEERLEWADLVIVGKISHVRLQFAIVMQDTNHISEQVRWQYDYGVVEIKDVLMGEEHLAGHSLPLIGVAFYSPSRSEGGRLRILQGFTDIKDGDEGIWILRRDALIGFWTAHCGKCFLPMDMLSKVMDVIHQKVDRVDGASSSN